ncbi:hypothetical protein PROCOU_13193 [Listeria rocourtiae FSL F6-920]|nr:hypothetical protein PROCOU_13193 [Listeria rocourtiae FSL F6-920]
MEIGIAFATLDETIPLNCSNCPKLQKIPDVKLTAKEASVISGDTIQNKTKANTSALIDVPSNCSSGVLFRKFAMIGMKPQPRTGNKATK